MKTRKGIKRFYQKNERRTLIDLGFKPTSGSGNGWIEKEDGENDRFICQLKSTDADSYRIHKLDLDKLVYHSSVSHKTPIFVIQFLEDNTLFALVRVEDLDKLMDLKAKPKKVFIGNEPNIVLDQKVTSGSQRSRKEFYEGRESKWQRR